MKDRNLTADQTPLLELRGVTKRYGDFVANEAIDLKIQPGEIHAILGENGAGKSTLMKTIFGVHHPEEGQIFWQGTPQFLENPAQARALGIGMVFQHFSLFETVSVLDNISLVIDEPRADLECRIIEKAKSSACRSIQMPLCMGCRSGNVKGSKSFVAYCKNQNC